MADRFNRAVTWVPAADDALRGFLTDAGWAPDGAHRTLDLLGDGSTTVKQVRLHTALVDGAAAEDHRRSSATASPSASRPGLRRLVRSGLGRLRALDVWQTCVLSLLVFTGASQFALVGVIAAGGDPAFAAPTGLLLGTRNTLYGLQVAPLVGCRGPRSGRRPRTCSSTSRPR